MAEASFQCTSISRPLSGSPLLLTLVLDQGLSITSEAQGPHVQLADAGMMCEDETKQRDGYGMGEMGDGGLNL